MTRPLSIVARSGLKLAALYDQPAATGPYPLVLLLHGYTGWKEEEYLSPLAEELARAGIAALRFDAPGSGKSEGTWAKDYRVSTHLAAANDVLDYAVSDLQADPKRLGLWGHSAGGLAAMVMASRRGDIAAVCCSQPSTANFKITPQELKKWQQTGWRDQTTDIFGVVRIPYDYYQDRSQYNSLRALADVHAPILFIAGTKDLNNSASSVKKLYQAAHKPKEYFEAVADHDYKWDPDALALINDATIKFFTKWLLS